MGVATLWLDSGIDIGPVIHQDIIIPPANGSSVEAWVTAAEEKAAQLLAISARDIMTGKISPDEALRQDSGKGNTYSYMPPKLQKELRNRLKATAIKDLHAQKKQFISPNKDSKMSILVVTLMYMPDGGPGAPLYGMLCENLARRGHEVTVIAGVPHYPTGRVPSEFRGRLVQRSHENGVEVVRVFVPSVDRSNLIQRFAQFLIYQIGASLAGLTQNYDVLLFSNPALELLFPFLTLSVLRRKPAVSSVHDVYPDVGVTLGIFRHKAIISAVGFFERFYLQRSAHVRVLSESFLQPLRSLGIPDNKMVLIYDWVDTDLIKPLSKDNGFARELKLYDDFVVLYAGNIGLSQGLEHVLAAAELLKDHNDIKFVFVGEGAGRELLIAQAALHNLGNVRFLPFQPRSRLPEVLATADVSLITLKRGIGTASLPSKSFSILASGRPILASVDVDSDTWQLVQRSEAGICVPPEDPQALAAAIRYLKDTPSLCKRFGEKGREYALQYHSPQAAAEKFEKLLQSAIATH